MTNQPACPVNQQPWAASRFVREMQFVWSQRPVSHERPRTNPAGAAAWLAVLFVLLTSGLRTGADDNETSEESLSALVGRVKASVVVVSFTGRDGEPLGLGSGFVVGDGLIATNLHVLGDARPISIRTITGDVHPVVAVYATDRAHDLAIVQVDAPDLPVLPLGDSDTAEQGQSIVAVGNPLGLAHSVVQGVISAVREDVDGQPMIQLAIPIERGNSGGPVVDRAGRVLGLITLKSQLTDNLGYAVAINSLKPLLDQPNPIPMSRWLTIGTLNPRHWEAPEDVRWRQRAGRILVDGRGRGFGGRSLCLSQKQLPEGPFEVAVTVRMDEDDGAAGLVFHADGGDRHYGFYPSSGQLRFSRFDGPDVFAWKVLDESPSPAYRDGDWNRLKVRIDGPLIQCFCNETLVFESRDAVYTTGRVGLAKFRHTTATFKEFEVASQVRSFAPSAETRAALLELLANITPRQPSGSALIDDILARSDSRTARQVFEDEATRLEQQAVRVRQLAAAVHAESVTRRLANLFQRESPTVDLAHAALLIAALDNVELEVDVYRGLVDEFAADLLAELDPTADDLAKRQRLDRYLFDELGFHGSRTNYGSASNSYFNEVLDDREGLPITLSVLYLTLAERMGLRAHGVGLPGHFVVRVQQGDEWQLVDVFDRGAPMTLDDAAGRVRSITGLEWQDDYLEPQSAQAIVVRMLRNLINAANDSDDVEAALRYVNVILALQPDNSVDRLYRAVLCYNTQRVEQGLTDVDWLLERQPEEVPMIRVQQLRELLSAMVEVEE